MESPLGDEMSQWVLIFVFKPGNPEFLQDSHDLRERTDSYKVRYDLHMVIFTLITDTKYK